MVLVMQTYYGIVIGNRRKKFPVFADFFKFIYRILQKTFVVHNLLKRFCESGIFYRKTF